MVLTLEEIATPGFDTQKFVEIIDGDFRLIVGKTYTNGLNEVGINYDPQTGDVLIIYKKKSKFYSGKMFTREDYSNILKEVDKKIGERKK